MSNHIFHEDKDMDNDVFQNAEHESGRPLWQVLPGGRAFADRSATFVFCILEKVVFDIVFLMEMVI